MAKKKAKRNFMTLLLPLKHNNEQKGYVSCAFPIFRPDTIRTPAGNACTNRKWSRICWTCSVRRRRTAMTDLKSCTGLAKTTDYARRTDSGVDGRKQYATYAMIRARWNTMTMSSNTRPRSDVKRGTGRAELLFVYYSFIRLPRHRSIYYNLIRRYIDCNE